MTPFDLTLLVECCCCSKPGANIPRAWNSRVGIARREQWTEEGVLNEDGTATNIGHQMLNAALLAGSNVYFDTVHPTPPSFDEPEEKRDSGSILSMILVSVLVGALVSIVWSNVVYNH